MEKVNVDPDDLEGTAVGNMSAETLVAAIRQNIVVNMDEQACSEALEGLRAYYKASPFL